MAAAEDRELSKPDGAATTAAWLCNLTGVSRGEAKRIIDPGRAFGDMVEGTRQAWAAGDLTTEQATIICQAINVLPDWVGDVERKAAQAALLDHAGRFATDDLRRLANHITEVIDPDGADEHLGKQLDVEEKKAWGQTEFSMHRAGDAMVRGRFLLPNVQAGMLSAVPEGLASPRRNDPRIYDRDGERCDARLLPIVLDGKSKILDLGLSKRLHSRYQRVALAKRDKGCVWKGCDRPPSWCEVHHPQWWSRGGPTDLNNGALFCFHHHLLHNGEWHARMAADGIPEVIGPKRIDPQQKPMRHNRFKAGP